MDVNKAIEWLEDVLNNYPPFDDPNAMYDAPMLGAPDADHDAQQWIASAYAAIRGVFPPDHAHVRTWESVAKQGWSTLVVASGNLEAVFKAALYDLKQGRLNPVFDTVRATTILEVLDVAEHLAAYPAAAMVLAAGALETHLSHLVARYGLTIGGNASIAAYAQAINAARNAGTAVAPTLSDMTHCTAWGQDRNTAAHTPASSTKTTTEVKAAIASIREFIARTT